VEKRKAPCALSAEMERWKVILNIPDNELSQWREQR
jgi:hypothetical protein